MADSYKSGGMSQELAIKLEVSVLESKHLFVGDFENKKKMIGKLYHVESEEFEHSACKECI